MKKARLFLLGLIGLASVQAYAVICPGPAQIEPFINKDLTNVRAVPFPQCYYTAKEVTKNTPQKNVCEAVHQSLNVALYQQYHLKVTNWYCNNVKKEGYNYDYTFTFQPQDS